MSTRKAIKASLLLVVLAYFFPIPAFADRDINWSSINPKLKSATSVGNTTECVECHESYIKNFEKTKHAKAYKAIWSKDGGSACESCHGPLSKHLAEKDSDKKLETVVSFKTITAKQKNQICLQCHESGERMFWQGSTHDINGVSCTQCHYVMEKKSRKFMTINEDPKVACFQCHRDVRARLERSFHMPLREGKLNCSACHNPHGGIGPKLLKAASVTETCVQCHQEKRGPLLWEHPPVRENCSNCHDAHGSNFTKMLKERLPYLCQTCHVQSGHPGTLFEGRNQANPFNSGARYVGNSCLSCHSQVHGSNAPSGAKLMR